MEAKEIIKELYKERTILIQSIADSAEKNN